MVKQAYSGENPDQEIQAVVETLPRRYREVILDKIVDESKWSELEEIYYYSERRLRELLNEGLEELDRRLKSTGKIHSDTD